MRAGLHLRDVWLHRRENGAQPGYHACTVPTFRQAHRWWRILLSTRIVLSEFRSRFVGKCRPVHFFWGGFDLACTRLFRPRKGVITSEAYSHECISAGFCPAVKRAAFYPYRTPHPQGLPEEPVRPATAFLA